MPSRQENSACRPDPVQPLSRQSPTIYWKLNEAYSIGGRIRDKWGQTGWEGDTSLLGYPMSDETVLPDGQGRMNRFERGVIYWSPQFGAHPVTGRILIDWASERYEAGIYGYPIADQQPNGPTDFIQEFQNGKIGWPTPIASFDTDSVDEDSYTGPPTEGGNDFAGTSGQNRTEVESFPGVSADKCLSSSTGGSGLGLCTAPSKVIDPVDPTVMQAPAPNSSPQLFNSPITLKEGCGDDYEAKKHGATGLGWWELERMYGCAVNPVVMLVRDLQTGVILASANAKLEEEFHVKYNSTTTGEYRFRYTIESINTRDGFSAAGMTLNAAVNCVSSVCSVATNDSVSNEPITLGAELFGYYTVNFGAIAPNSPALVDRLHLAWTLSKPGAFEAVPGDATSGKQSPEIRCDNDTGQRGISAGIPSQGCVFPERSPVLDFASNPIFAPITDHIKRAQQSGLRGAESLYATGPLTRMTAKAERDRNGNRACPSGRYSASGVSCDEYPFRSTYQGAAQPPGVILDPNGRTFTGCQISDLPRVDPSRTGPNGYSVCMVSKSANDVQGREMATFYYKNRVRDGEEFFVRADTGQ